MNNTVVIDIFSSNNGNTAGIRTQHCQIATNTTNGILKLEPMIKTTVVADNAKENYR